MISGRAAIGIAVVMMVLSFAVLVPGNSVPATRAINTGDGLSGGGDLDDDLTLVSDLAATLVGGVTTSASGLQFVSADFGLLTCASGEIQKTTAALAWECATDSTAAGGQAVTLDLGDDASNESTDLGEIATLNDANGIFSEPSADKLLIDLDFNWPGADTSTQLAVDPTDCGANTFADSISALGDLTCNAVTTLDITDDTILESDLDFVDSAADEFILTFESGAGGDFEWHSCAEITGSADLCDGSDATGGGTANVLDLDDDDADESTDLVEIATIGDSNAVFTEPSADKLLINLLGVWSGGAVTSTTATTSTGAATAAALAADPSNCAAGQWAAGITALGTAKGCTADDDTPDDDSEVPDTLTVDNASTVDPDALSCDVGDDNLISEDCIGDVLDASEIEDIYLFDDGDVGTGTFDFGGADDFELPNATNGTTVDTDGQITIDLRSSTTTAPSINAFTSSTEWALPLEDEHGLLLLSATTADDFPLMTYEYPIEVIEVCMLALGGQTRTGNLVEYDENGANPTDLFTDKTVGATRQCINTFTDDDIAARGWIGIDTTSVSATVTTLHISWRFRVKPER